MHKKQESKPMDMHSINQLYKEIQEIYLGDKRPWVIGYSGGKDSTVVVQLIWKAVELLSPDKRTKPIYVISSDTLVETPVIVKHIDTSLDRINKAAKEQNLPFQAHKVKPKLNDTFWVNMIGKGYPAPYTRFRWCTDRLKIEPANRFIMDKVTEFGEVIVVLGSRRQESTTRAQVMSLYKIQGTPLSRHSILPSAYCYTPIENFSTNDVWVYLMQVPSPWGNNNHDLLTLYKNSQAGECPLVIDTSTPSCGNSRFGCWVCTVVKQDHTMEALIENGEEWMTPMLEFRDWLSSTQDPETKSKYREYKRRNGQVSVMDDGRIVRGPYKFSVRQEMLKKLLEIEKEVRQKSPDQNISLISIDELKEIRKLWISEEQDWEDSLPKIFSAVYGDGPTLWDKDDLVSFNAEDKRLLDAIAEEEGVPAALIAKLLDAERESHGMGRRSAIYSKLDEIIREEWKSEEEVLKEHKNHANKNT